MRTVKYRVTEPMSMYELGDIIECPMVFEGSMNDGIILHFGEVHSCLEVVSLTEKDDGIYEATTENFINIRSSPEFLSTIDALKIMA